MQIFKRADTLNGAADVVKMFDLTATGVQVYRVEVAPGVRTPAEGFGSHAAEYDLIVSGTSLICSGGEEYQAEAGDFIVIPAGERHYTLNNGDAPCEVLSIVVEV